jgi:hypothetical protein
MRDQRNAQPLLEGFQTIREKVLVGDVFIDSIKFLPICVLTFRLEPAVELHVAQRHTLFEKLVANG